MIRNIKTRFALAAIITLFFANASAQKHVLKFVYTSDVHYGITRANFRGADSVPSAVVNQAMIAAINQLPKLSLPQDGGVAAGTIISTFDALAITGDIANRQEKGVQSAASSWAQFEADYTHKLSIKNKAGKTTPLLLCAGNHDIADALGNWRPAVPATDASSLAGIYNLMFSPAKPKTAANYNYATDKVHYSRDMNGIHLVFINLWPDSLEQRWIAQDIKNLKPGTPVLLFAHATPEAEARFFTNPNGNHSINATDKFENLLPEVFRDGKLVKDSAKLEQQGFVMFLKHHPQIKAYFHGHNNWAEFYDWQSQNKSVTLPCFRVDSPMKGAISAKDETKLSFEVITIDTQTLKMTVREVLWNTVPNKPSVLAWGQHKTISLQ